MIPFNRPIKTAEPYGPSYSNTVIGTLAVDGWAVTLVQRGGDWAQFFFLNMRPSPRYPTRLVHCVIKECDCVS